VIGFTSLTSASKAVRSYNLFLITMLIAVQDKTGARKELARSEESPLLTAGILEDSCGGCSTGNETCIAATHDHNNCLREL
jgi:uncharacterized membrane protein YsdA (DUF1294 family)